MKTFLSAYAGLDLHPLPHESVMSVILRFAHENVLDAKQTKALLGKKTISQFSNWFLNPDWYRENSLETITNWTFPEASECQVMESLGGLAQNLFASQVRICPICFSSGYHSIWNQLILLKHCPLHQCELRSACTNCKVEIGEFRFSKALFLTPYMCNACGKPLSGSAFSSEEHLLLRSNSRHLLSVYAGFSDWLELAKRNFTVLHAINLDRVAAHQWNEWCQTDHFYRGIAGLLAPYPVECGSDFFGGPITVLGWKLHIHKGGMKSGDVTLARDSYCRGIRRQMARAVYSVALRHLHKWVRKDPTIASVSDLTACAFDSDSVDMMKWSPRVAAFVLLRMSFESGATVSMKCDFRPIAFHFDHSPPMAFYPELQTDPRAGYFAMYLGIYSAYYWMFERARRTGTANLRTITRSFERKVAKFLLISKSHMAGGVLFPTVPGLPLPKIYSPTFLTELLNSNELLDFRPLNSRFG
jgi:hypothetical protein